MVVAPPAGAREHVPGDTVVAGLPLRHRIVLAGTRAGFAQVMADAGAAGKAPARLQRIVVLAANVIPQAAWLRDLREMPLPAETVAVDPERVALVVETRDPERVVEAAARGASPDELLAELRGRLTVADRALDPRGRFPIPSLRELPRAEDWLFGTLMKANEGFMSRHVERRISFAITRRLITTPVTPNSMTLLSVALGLVGALGFLSPERVVQCAGALLFLAHSILDGCDGEIARLKFMESRTGAILDFWGDNVVHVAVFSCMAIGWALEAAAVWPLAVGLVAVTGTLASASLAARGFIHGAPLAATGLTSRITAALSGRDFIYAVVLFAALGKGWWFVVPVAAGTPVFVLLSLISRRRTG